MAPSGANSGAGQFGARQNGGGAKTGAVTSDDVCALWRPDLATQPLHWLHRRRSSRRLICSDSASDSFGKIVLFKVHCLKKCFSVKCSGTKEVVLNWKFSCYVKLDNSINFCSNFYVVFTCKKYSYKVQNVFRLFLHISTSELFKNTDCIMSTRSNYECWSILCKLVNVYFNKVA